MIASVLVANRGEIARRVFRTCRGLGIGTVAVYSDADAQALHVKEADQAVRLGPPPARESYLLGDRVIAAALETGAEAIHPGYGFLSENAEFAEAVTAAGLVWIGPPPSAIRAMGLKDAAKRLMIEAGVPTTPGYLGDDQEPARLQAEADRIGYPLLIKAVAGGGGKGMRKVERADDFAAALGSAKREAAASFGDDRVLLETYVARPRHIEVQVFGDAHGNTVHLFERDCSLQRRHQKVIEEAPAPGMDDATRESVCGAAVRAAQAVGYVGAGTVEFIADASEGLRADRIFFMEMNTRLQVEHPVTEMITGQDLVEWQIRVASGEPLPLRQDELKIDGWAMEARLYAENPATGFLPSTGRFEHLRLPEYLGRVDSAVEQGGEVTAFYDPMIAKLVAGGYDRGDAIERLEDACAHVSAWPVRTNAGFLVRCLRDEAFRAGDVDTGLIVARGDALTAPPEPPPEVIAAAFGQEVIRANWAPGRYPKADAEGPWGGEPSGTFGFRLNGPARSVAGLSLGERRYTAELTTRPVEHVGEYAVDVVLDGRTFEARRSGADWRVGDVDVRLADEVREQIVAFVDGDAYAFDDPDGDAAFETVDPGSGAIASPMPGKIVAVHIAEGAEVAKGAPLVTLEAMKMEHVLTAPFDGRVSELSIAVGAQVSEGVTLVRLEAAGS